MQKEERVVIVLVDITVMAKAVIIEVGIKHSLFAGLLMFFGVYLAAFNK